MQAQTTGHSGKTALITGAARGIGRELTKLFAKDGYNLVLVDREENDLRQLETELSNQYGSQTTLLIKDLGDPNVPNEIYAETNGKGQTIDVLVNDAGFGVAGRFATETDLERELGIIQVNATALMHLTKLFVKDMVARNDGKILLLGSTVSVNPSPLQAVYGATKAFIKSFGESIREELKETNITVTVLMPGATNTHFFETAGAAHLKVADPKTTADPADVAKEGYDALMSGKDHVVAGFMNKLNIALAHILPDPLLASRASKSMVPRDDAAEAKKQQQTLITIGAAVAVIGGLWLLSRNRRDVGISAYDETRYRYKAGKAGFKAKSAANSAADSIKSVYNDAKATVESALV